MESAVLQENIVSQLRIALIPEQLAERVALSAALRDMGTIRTLTATTPARFSVRALALAALRVPLTISATLKIATIPVRSAARVAMSVEYWEVVMGPIL